MDKSWYKSKTIWGIVVVGAILLGQQFGVQVTDTFVAELVKLAGIILAAIGYRDAI